MNISYRQDDQVVIAELEGSLDTNTSQEAENSLNNVIDEGAKNLLIDLERTAYISSAGLRVLLGLAKRQMKSGGKLHIVAMNSTIKEIFLISGFDGLIQSSDTIEAGVVAIKG